MKRLDGCALAEWDLARPEKGAIPTMDDIDQQLCAIPVIAAVRVLGGFGEHTVPFVKQITKLLKDANMQKESGRCNLGL